MSAVQIELTEKQWEIVEEIWASVEKEIAHLAALSREQRLAWFREHQYPRPISFEREIGGTVYTVTGSYKGAESFVRRLERITAKNFVETMEVGR